MQQTLQATQPWQRDEDAGASQPAFLIVPLKSQPKTSYPTIRGAKHSLDNANDASDPDPLCAGIVYHGINRLWPEPGKIVTLPVLSLAREVCLCGACLQEAIRRLISASSASCRRLKAAPRPGTTVIAPASAERRVSAYAFGSSHQEGLFRRRPRKASPEGGQRRLTECRLNPELNNATLTQLPIQ